ncbi:MAG: iron-sulfur cluster assembly accessory protein [Mariprofundus sp.]|nr:iron-sulfur cluster assembly accessory protein [Mariprofundus sp.]
MNIKLTEAAVTRMHELVSEACCKGLRLAVRPAGCSGMEYVMDLVAEAEAGDLIRVYDGFELYVDGESYASALTGLQLDFQRDLLSSGFVYNNPNEKGSCGCGKSFSV